MRIYECRYVRRGDPGDLLTGYLWRKAIIVDECPHLGELFMGSSSEIEKCMFDYDTGKNVGDTYNFCVNPNCCHSDCAPMTLICEVENAK